ncbi:MAG: hypothetical protein KatS3mg082_2875 [Nitrospiraceae bacterium]|nr:MAG: hypothetical protein KatS3mg082_2875 [Nitrospiraceae bacterium]
MNINYIADTKTEEITDTRTYLYTGAAYPSDRIVKIVYECAR